LIFHILQFVVEGEFLVAMVVREAAAELECGCDSLKVGRELLDGRDRRVIIRGGRIVLRVFVGQFLGAGEGKLFVSRVNLAGKIVRLLGEIEDAGAAAVGKFEFRLVGFDVVGVAGDFGGALVLGGAVGGDGDRVMRRIGAGKIEREAEGRGIGGVQGGNGDQEEADQ
jgi:hypothetical protein